MAIQNILHRICFHSRNIIKNRRIFDFTVQSQDGKAVPLSGYKGKVLLIVNTATGCGFTPQYDELQDLYELHQKDGLEILDFPCNQFAEQAPGSDEEIHSFCQYFFCRFWQEPDVTYIKRCC